MSESDNSTAQIRIEGIIKDYGNVRVLDDIRLSIAGGEFLTLLGPSGSGKSTLLMTIAGFVEPSQGEIYVAGKPIVSVRPENRNFGVVFQGYALFPHMTVATNVAYPLTIRGMSKAEIAKRVGHILDLVQLEKFASRYPTQLSGGQQQRVALARALVFSPEILLLDEPMGALDKNLRHDLQLELRQLHSRLGRTFVNVTHDQEEAMSMSDRIAIMRDGRVVQIGQPRDLYANPNTRFVAAFLGKSNFIEGRVTALESGVAVVDTADGPVRHAMRNREGSLEKGAHAVLALRPQKLLLKPRTNARNAQVTSAVFLGTHAEVNLRCASGHPLLAQFALSDAASLPEAGEEVAVGWEPDSTVCVEAD
ncbi:MAG: ABC transporter ATP-binding protein [Mesorhizobium sp.]|nr:MAG: ABC transporter ATP-binding protein [Mesorhizobium sp.]